MGRLTTHVLDTANGVPAVGMDIILCDSDGSILRIDTTNIDGRLDSPLLEGEDFAVGEYTLEFSVAKYFATQGVDLPDPPFFDVVSIAFAVANADAHYHVPLLVSPFGYTTYRGS